MARSPHRKPLIISLLLLVLITRALVPAGFMPAGDGTAQLTLCPDGMVMPADGHTAGGTARGAGHLHTDHCPFGSAPFAAPIAHRAVLPEQAGAISIRPFDFSPWQSVARVVRSHPPRAPPARTVV